MNELQARRDRERDLILGPGEYANILDETKGHVTVWVGPSKASLSATDRPVVFNPKDRRFMECLLEESIITFPFAPKGSYVVLQSPTKIDGDGMPHPQQGSNNLTKLEYGKRINIEGPVTFALFPGQVAEVIDGHRLRSNQYLVVRVYDEEAARKNWSKATVKPQKEGDETPIEDTIKVPDLTMGKLLVIEGTKVSFYIPPTGVEVVREEGKFVREAITLERLEYCILLDEDGNKRYLQGPSVVFPKPTEQFIEKDGTKKFRAIELNEIMGIYIKVIADYEEDGKKYKAGEELFITGKDQRIYYPRPEHAIITYGGKQRTYAIAIPDGEARYVLDRMTGKISLKRGPCMFLPDPRKEVIVRRVLDPREVELWFPGNSEALQYNINLSQLVEKEEPLATKSRRYVSDALYRGGDVAFAFAGTPGEYTTLTEQLDRGTKFTPPRTITLDTKYDGAVTIDAWPGYAVQVVKKTGERQVIVGPKVHLLEYDETLEKMELSTGTPKTDKKLKKDVYLRVLHNTVSDFIDAETKDLCPVRVLLSYRVNFEGESSKWFNVENYVKFLTEHLRSILKNKIKQVGIESFYSSSIDFLRDTILGKTEDGSRPGKTFEENGMRVYDVEVLEVEILDSSIADLLETAEHDTVRQKLILAKKDLELAMTKKTEKINQEIEEIKAQTIKKRVELALAKETKDQELSMVRIENKREAEEANLKKEIQNSNLSSTINDTTIAIKKANQQNELEYLDSILEQEIAKIESETGAVIKKAEAISPDLIAVLSDYANKDLAGKLAENLNVLSIIGGGKKSVVEIFKDLLGDTGLGEVLGNKLQFHLHNKNARGE